MNRQSKKTVVLIITMGIAAISIFINAIVVPKYIELLKQNNGVIEQEESKETIIEETIDKDQNIQPEENAEESDKSKDKEYIYKYIEGKEKEKQVVVEKEIEKIVEVPASPTDATVTYIDASGSTKIINLPSGTTINFSAGEHGIYDILPSSITLTDNQELDITDSSYYPSKVEVNYIFKGFSYSGNTLKCEYSLANNIVNVECKQVENTIIKNNVLYTQLDYLESTGTQYINTGITTKNNSSFEIDMMVLSPTENSYYVSGGSTTSRFHFAAFHDGIHFGLGSSYTTTPTIDFQRHTYKLSNVDGKAYIDNTLSHTFTPVSFTNAESIKIFCARDITAFGSCKCWNIKIKEGTELKLNLIPAERYDGVIGMLDLVNGGFLTNAGSGVFQHSDPAYIPGINAGRIMASGSYEAGSSIELKAVANTDYTFVGWSDNTLNATRTVTIGDNTVYTALFEHN